MKRFDELANAPSSAQERKRRRDKLTDQDIVKSAAKNQAVVQTFPSFPDHQDLSAVAMSPRVAATYAPTASPAWHASAQRPSVGGDTVLPRSALSSPQLATLFASPDRVRKQSDEEKRCLLCVHVCILGIVCLTLVTPPESSASVGLHTLCLRGPRTPSTNTHAPSRSCST